MSLPGYVEYADFPRAHRFCAALKIMYSYIEPGSALKVTAWQYPSALFANPAVTQY